MPWELPNRLNYAASAFGKTSCWLVLWRVCRSYMFLFQMWGSLWLTLDGLKYQPLTLYLRENLKFDRKHGICSLFFLSRGHQGATEDEVRGFRDSPFSSLELWWARKGSVVRPQNHGWMLTHRTYFTRPSFGIKLESMDVDECLWRSKSTHVWAGRSWERGKQHKNSIIWVAANCPSKPERWCSCFYPLVI